MISERKVGPHTAVKESEDVLTIHFGSSPSAAEMTALIDWQMETMADRPYFLALDFAQCASLSADARRAVGEGTKKLNYRGIGMYQASFHMKVVAKLINHAIALFKKNPLRQEFFDTHAAALTWFDELRRRDAAGGA